MFDELDSQRSQLRLLTAAARSHFGKDTEPYRVFSAALRVADIAQADRHKLAHWIWGHCPELPNALLLADPKAVRAQTIELTRMLDKRKDSLVYVLSVDDEERKQDEVRISQLYAPDKSAIFVYEDGDFHRSTRDLGEALLALHYFAHYLSPLKLNPLSPPNPALEGLETSDGALRRLMSLRLFREVYARADCSKDQSSTPKPPP